MVNILATGGVENRIELLCCPTSRGTCVENGARIWCSVVQVTDFYLYSDCPDS